MHCLKVRAIIKWHERICLPMNMSMLANRYHSPLYIWHNPFSHCHLFIYFFCNLVPRDSRSCTELHLIEMNFNTSSLSGTHNRKEKRKTLVITNLQKQSLATRREPYVELVINTYLQAIMKETQPGKMHTSFLRIWWYITENMKPLFGLAEASLSWLKGHCEKKPNSEFEFLQH